MNSIDDAQEIPAFIRELMPDASREEFLEATNNVKRYLAAVLRIHQSLAAEGATLNPTSRTHKSFIRFPPLLIGTCYCDDQTQWR